MNQHFSSASADERPALRGRHEVIPLLQLGLALSLVTVSRCASRRSLIQIRVSEALSGSL